MKHVLKFGVAKKLLNGQSGDKVNDFVTFCDVNYVSSVKDTL